MSETDKILDTTNETLQNKTEITNKTETGLVYNFFTSIIELIKSVITLVYNFLMNFFTKVIVEIISNFFDYINIASKIVLNSIITFLTITLSNLFSNILAYFAGIITAITGYIAINFFKKKDSNQDINCSSKFVINNVEDNLDNIFLVIQLQFNNIINKDLSNYDKIIIQNNFELYKNSMDKIEKKLTNEKLIK